MLSYSLLRSKRRSISIEVHARGELVVRSPMRMPVHVIEDFLRSKGPWIARKLADAQASRSIIPPLPSADHIHHRGLPIIPELDGRVVEASKVDSWEMKTAQIVFNEIIGEMLPLMGVASLRYKEFSTRKMKRRWGSCRVDGKITLNQYLIRVPDQCIRSVIAHELAHLVHMDHGPDFHALVRQIMPEYDEASELLDAWTAVLEAVETRKGAELLTLPITLPGDNCRPA